MKYGYQLKKNNNKNNKAEQIKKERKILVY